MLLLLTEYLEQFYSGFNLFRYLTVRGILGVLTALFISLLLGPIMIKKLSRKKIGQTVRDDGPQSHLSKAGTPTMGGAFILIAISVATLLWGNLENKYIWVTLLTTLGFGIVGWIDDYRKLVYKNSDGLAARWKYFWQSLVGLTAAIYLYTTATLDAETTLIIPFFKNVAINLGLLYILMAYLVIVGTSNAVNLTETGNIKFSAYLAIPYIPGAGELIIFCGALVGAGLGFLWFNTYPAQVFMGDVGSLGLGAALGIVAVIVRQELVLFIMGGVFVIETVSVILQVVSYKLTGKRIFNMAPLHHHYELKGWPEPRVIVRFWIISVVLVLIGLATLKIR